MASFEHLLAECLQDLSREGGVEESLQSHPQQADQLRPLLEMAQAAHAYYQVVPAAPGGLAAGRERMLAAAAQGRSRHAVAATKGAPTRTVGGTRWRLGLTSRLMALVLAVALITVSVGSGLVWAARDSLPGHLLYPLKLATEDARLALASEPADEVDLALAFVEERAGEIEALAALGSGIPSGAVTRMEQHVERALAQAAGTDDVAMDGLLEQIVIRTRVQAQRLDGLQADVSQQTLAGLGHAAAVCRRGAEAAEQGLSDPATFRWRYHHGAGETEPLPEPEQPQERYQQRNQDEGGVDKGRPTATPTPRSAEASRTPRFTPERPQATVTPRTMPTRQHQNAEPTGTRAGPLPTATEPEPKGTPHRSDVTGTPTATSHAPRVTDGPHPTSQAPHATATPHAAPQDPPPMPGQPRETPGPRPPGGGNH